MLNPPGLSGEPKERLYFSDGVEIAKVGVYRTSEETSEDFAESVDGDVFDALHFLLCCRVRG